ncbi:hypothetical protein L0F63_000623 [Massospora cicadina]|nr:hypothetical protein L0F63_000623 [Massospora cicadina]
MQSNVFGISFGKRFPDQAGATILIYNDSLGLQSHSGVEIEQGIHAKVVQSCANALRVLCYNTYVTETSTNKVPNASAIATSTTATSDTASSVSSNLNAMAVLNACYQLNERLQTCCDPALYHYTKFTRLYTGGTDGHLTFKT